MDDDDYYQVNIFLDDEGNAQVNVTLLTLIRLFGLFSMIASGFLFRDISRKLAQKSSSGIFLTRISLTQSVLIVLSLGDFFGAFIVQFVSTWMVPHHSWLLGSTGSQASCTAQGFLSNFFYSLSGTSNASLAVAYSLIVRCDWGDGDKNKNRLPFVLIPIIISLVLAVVPLFGQNYNYNGGYSCHISGHPPGCEFYPGTCERGAQARIMLFATSIIPMLVAFCIITAAVILLIHAVLIQERRMDRYNSGTGRSRKMTMQSFWQGICYVGSFTICWTPWLVYGFEEYLNVRTNAATYYTMIITFPLHGVLNTAVYFRPRYKAERERNPTDSRCRSLMQILHIKCCCNRKSKQGFCEPSPIAFNPAKEQGGETRVENKVTPSCADTPPTCDPETAKDAHGFVYKG